MASLSEFLGSGLVKDRSLVVLHIFLDDGVSIPLHCFAITSVMTVKIDETILFHILSG